MIEIVDKLMQQSRLIEHLRDATGGALVLC